MEEKIKISGLRSILPYFGKWMVLIENPDGMFYLPDDNHDKAMLLSPSETEDVKNALVEYDKNRMSFFLPHGPKKGGGLDFINDWKNQICLLTSPTRCGKSAHGCIFSLLRTLKSDPKWHCFKHHGIICPDYRGKRKLVISSYEWTNVQELWEEYLRWLPRNIANKYLPDWGKYPEEKGRPRIIDLKTGKVTKATLGDGSEVLFRCDRQGQGPWEGQRWDDAQFDEQRQREKFIGYLRGTSNTQGLTQCCFTLTGHVVPDRPDTGAAGWIKRDLFDGHYTFGRSIGRYKLSIDTTPSVVMSDEEKERLYIQWVIEPRKNKNEEDMRKAQARYFGGWEHGSGLVIENFFPEDHLVPDIVNFENDVFKDATKYRGMDHGLGRPATAAWCMMFSWGDLLMYREYYQPGQTIPYHAIKISEMSGSRRIEADVYQDDTIGEAFKTYQEVFDKEEYYSSVMDCRSFASPAQESNRTIGQLYNDWGLYCSPSQGYQNDKIVPLMRAWFALQEDRPHLMWQLHKRHAVSDEVYETWLKARNGEVNKAPRIYFVDHLRHVQSEIHSWAKKPDGRPKAENDHIIGGALKYIIAEDPKYWGDFWRENSEDDESHETPKGKYCSY